MLALVRALPLDSAFARANGAPLDPISGLIEVVAGVLGARSTTTGTSSSRERVVSLTELAAMAPGGER